MKESNISFVQKLYTLLIVTLLSSHCLGQGLNVELGFNDKHWQIPGSPMVCTDDYTYLVLVLAEASNTLQKLDTNGNVLW